MKLARFRHEGAVRAGLVLGDELVDLAAWDSRLPGALDVLLADLDRHRAVLERAAESGPRIPLAAVDLLAPIPSPARFLAAGLNYRDHARELGLAVPARPRLFAKLAGVVGDPHGDVRHPGVSDTLDYEGELGIVIGGSGRADTRAEAQALIGGYVVIDDLGLREFVNPDLVTIAKSCTGFAPCGPWITTADEIPDPDALTIRTWVNDELRQNSSTRELVFGCVELVQCVARLVALAPGDLITTGSPPGSGAGMNPPRFLQPGDRVRIDIERLGAIEHRITR